MKTVKKGGLVITLEPGSGAKSLRDELAEAPRLAAKIIDKHGGRGPFRKFDDDAVELLYADVLKRLPEVISNGLDALPEAYRPQLEQLLFEAVNLGRALEGMDIYIQSIERLTKKPVTAAERKAVVDLDQKLKGDFPITNPRYEKIARLRDIPVGRVRYIIEGQRRAPGAGRRKKGSRKK